MAHKDYNKKAPKSKVCNQKTKPKYGFVHGNWDECGGHDWVYVNAEEGKKTFRQKLNPSGGYQVTEADDDVKEGHFEITPGNKHSYVGAGHSVHVDGHCDFNTESTFKLESGGDNSWVAKMNGMIGIGGKKIELVKDGSAKVIAGGSSGTNDVGVNGDHRQTFKKNKYTKVEGDTVDGHEGKYVQMNNKDTAYYFNENWDAFAKQKIKLESKQAFKAFSQDTMLFQSDQDMTANSAAKIVTKSKSDTTIESDTKIELKVGSSTITIESGSITIKSPQIKFEQG